MRAVGSVFSSVYFPSVDTLAPMELQVTPEVRARGPGVPSEPGFSFPLHATLEESLRGPRLRMLQLLHRQINTPRFY